MMNDSYTETEKTKDETTDTEILEQQEKKKEQIIVKEFTRKKRI